MGNYFAVFRSAFALAGGRSENLPRALVRHALRPFAPFATVPLRRWVDECNGRFKTGHVRHSFFRRATAPLTFRGRGALGVGVLFFYYIIFYSCGSILPLWFYLRLYRRTRGGGVSHNAGRRPSHSVISRRVLVSLPVCRGVVAEVAREVLEHLFAQVGGVEMGVDFGGADVLVAEHHLDGTQGSTALE